MRRFLGRWVSHMPIKCLLAMVAVSVCLAGCGGEGGNSSPEAAKNYRQQFEESQRKGLQENRPSAIGGGGAAPGSTAPGAMTPSGPGAPGAPPGPPR
jgi:predicted small lipoprotein YifL